MADEGLIIRREAYSSAAARQLAAALHAELLARYDGVEGAGGEPSPADFEPPLGVFLVATIDGRPVACGGLVRHGDGIGEIRRMYVDPVARGKGLARRMLSSLEAAARDLGYAVVRLETGDRQPEAIALYAAAGYRPIDRFGPFVNDERSVCMEKKFAAQSPVG